MVSRRIHALEARLCAVRHGRAVQADHALHQRRLATKLEIYACRRRCIILRAPVHARGARSAPSGARERPAGDLARLEACSRHASSKDVIDELHRADRDRGQDIVAQVESAKLARRSGAGETVAGEQCARSPSSTRARCRRRPGAVIPRAASTELRTSDGGKSPRSSLTRRRRRRRSRSRSRSGGERRDRGEDPALGGAAVGGPRDGERPAASRPVNGPIRSPFGIRWSATPGRHRRPEGTPIHAAAAGTVIYCGWESGYGNLASSTITTASRTAYGHQSRVAVSCGQDVAQGDVIGYSGCTGFCTGLHAVSRCASTARQLTARLPPEGGGVAQGARPPSHQPLERRCRSGRLR